MKTIKQVVIPYAPRTWAKQFHDSGKRWMVLCCHRRAGKTVAAINHLIRDAIRIKGARLAFISPTYKQSKRLAWDYLKHYARTIQGVTFNEVELRADFPSQSRISLYGADNPDSLRGIGLDGVIFDEYSQQPPNIFGEIIRPALADRQGYGIFLGTIQGKNHLYRLYEAHKADPEWFALYLKASRSGILPKTELDAAKKEMTEDEYMQEFELEPAAAMKGSYYSEQLREMRKAGRVKQFEADPSLPVYTVWDLGIGDTNVIGFFQDVGPNTHVVDVVADSGKGLDHYARVLKEKGFQYSRHVAPHDIEVRELGSGKSRRDVARSLGITFEIAPSLGIDDGIHALRMNFHRLWFNETTCNTFLDALSQYRKAWDDKAGMFRDAPFHDWTSHYADMLRYWAVSYKGQNEAYEASWDFEAPTYL